MFKNRARGTLRNLVVSNTNQFTVQSVDFSPIRLRFALKLHFPVLSLRTNYQNTVGRSFNCQLSGNGNGDADLYSKSINCDQCLILNNIFNFIHFNFFLDLSADVEVYLSITIWGKLSISRLTTSASIGSARVNVNSFTSNNDACNAELSRTLPQTFRNNQAFINKLVSDLVLPLANGVLQNMSLSDLLDLINGNTPSPFPPC